MSDTLIEKDNYLRFIIFFIDVGKDMLLKVFTYIDTGNPGKVVFPLSKCPELEKKIRKKFPQNLQRTILEAESAADFDISILSRLLCNVFPYLIPEGLKNDVEHLRQVRNSYLAHPSEARFSNAVFEQLWQEVGMIFKNIIDEVAPGNKSATALATTIEEYRNQPIDATKAREYICYLETQIEALRKELLDYTTLCKNKQTPFLQYVKFLLNCGSSILSAYLCHLLEKQNVSLERLLHGNHSLTSRELPEWMTQQLYSKNEDTIEVNTDTKSWDLSVLAAVIEIIFGKDIEEYDLTAIVSIRKARQTYAYSAIYAITKDDRFNQEREDLVASLKTLAMHTGKGSYQEFKRFLEEYRSLSETGADSKEYFAKLKCHGPGIKDIRDLHRESVEKITAETGSTLFVNEAFELEVMLQIACEDSSKQAEAESFLHSFLESILANPNSQPEGPDFPEVRTTIRKINNIPTVRLTCVQKSCLLITVECRSSQGLLSVINFIDGSEFLRQLNLISAELMDHFGDLFILNGHVTLDSLVKTLMLKDIDNSTPYAMDVKCLKHNPETIHIRQQEEREPPKTDIPLESNIRQLGDIDDTSPINLEHNVMEKNANLMKRLSSLEEENKQLRIELNLNKHKSDWQVAILVYTGILQFNTLARNQSIYLTRRFTTWLKNSEKHISELEAEKNDLTKQISRMKVHEAKRKQEQLQKHDLEELLETSVKIERYLDEARSKNYELSTKLSKIKRKMSQAEKKYHERLSKI